jgi:hypothetical protein
MEGSVPLESYGVDEYKKKFGSFLAERERRIKQEEKVLLAIASTNMNSKMSKWDFRRRHITCNAWISFDPQWHSIASNTHAPNRTCSLQEYQNYTSPSDHDACQFVYTFLTSGHGKGNYSRTADGGSTIKQRDEPSTMNPSLFNGTYETDILYMNVNENDGIGLGWAWNNYVVNLFEQAGYNNDFD